MAENKPQSFDDVLHRLGEFFKGLSFQQRFLLVAGVALVGGTLWVFVVLLGQPKYVTLYSGLRPEEAQALGAAPGGEKHSTPDFAGRSEPAGARGQARCQPAGDGGGGAAAQRAHGI